MWQPQRLRYEYDHFQRTIEGRSLLLDHVRFDTGILDAGGQVQWTSFGYLAASVDGLVGAGE